MFWVWPFIKLTCSILRTSQTYVRSRKYFMSILRGQETTNRVNSLVHISCPKKCDIYWKTKYSVFGAFHLQWVWLFSGEGDKKEVVFLRLIHTHYHCHQHCQIQCECHLLQSHSNSRRSNIGMKKKTTFLKIIPLRSAFWEHFRPVP